MADHRDYEIICPYCFFKFPHDKTVFRANTALSPSDLDIGSDDGLLGSSISTAKDAARKHFRKYDAEDSFASDKKLDEPLIAFWRDRGGKSGYMPTDKKWDYPHIDPSSPSFHEMISKEPVANLKPDPNDGFVRDRDGFITRVVDILSEPTVPMTRLCPGCHNPLPLPDYGKYPVIFISVVGVTGAGKTVYLNQLLTRFSDAVEGTGYRVGAHNLQEIGESVCPGSPLPESTDKQIVRRPLVVSLMRDNPKANQPTGLSIVFYDIAGENCVNTNGEPDEQQAKSTVGNFIAFSDGLIFLIDPEQLPPFASGREPRTSDISQVVSVMNRVRADINLEKPYWDDIPVAVTIAKSDKLRNCASIPRDNAIFTYPDEKKAGYHREENMGIHNFLSELLDSSANATIAPLNSFNLRNYFAVSAITCGVESRFEKYQNVYILDSENESKFHDLRRWITDWNARSPENRKYYRKCAETTQDGQPIVFDVEQDITEELADSILTEIRADSVECDSIYLTLWDVAQAVNLIGFPMADPAPRRVEDPLKWIMWQQELMGPYFTPRPAERKPIWITNRRWQEMLNELDIANKHDKMRFYGQPIKK